MLSTRGVQWIFNVECAPWWGGVFERMVRSTKRCLRKMVGRANLSQDELHAAVIEIEAVINSRPLLYISSTDLEEPLTPSHLLVGRQLLNLPDYLGYVCDPGDEDFEVNNSQLKRRMKHLASVLSHFWRRRRTEYLNELRECHRYSTAKKAHLHPTVSPGDIVIIHDDALPRGFWKLGHSFWTRWSASQCTCKGGYQRSTIHTVNKAITTSLPIGDRYRETPSPL